MGQCFPKPYKPSGWHFNFKVDLSNLLTKLDLKKMQKELIHRNSKCKIEIQIAKSDLAILVTQNLAKLIK